MGIDLDKVNLMVEIDALRRGWQASERQLEQARAEVARMREALEALAKKTGFEEHPDVDPATIKEHLEITLDAQVGAIGRLRAEAARLREALEPFAARVKQYPLWIWTAMVEREKQGIVSGGFRVGGEEITHMPAMLLVDAESALASTPTTAEWLAARDEEQRRIGAAMELEKLGEWCRYGDVNPDDARDEIARACKNRAAQLRKGE